jgi:hypothetical protein
VHHPVPFGWAVLIRFDYQYGGNTKTTTPEEEKTKTIMLVVGVDMTVPV